MTLHAGTLARGRFLAFAAEVKGIHAASHIRGAILPAVATLHVWHLYRRHVACLITESRHLLEIALNLCRQGPHLARDGLLLLFLRRHVVAVESAVLESGVSLLRCFERLVDMPQILAYCFRRHRVLPTQQEKRDRPR